MKKYLPARITFFFILLISAGFSQMARAQKVDTTVFDYDNYTFCNACGDFVNYNAQGTKDSLTDATPGSEYVVSLRVKVKLFTCYSGVLDLTLNGTVVGSLNSSYNCACGACDSITFNISEANISKYYKYGQKNVFRVMTRGGSSGLYLDRSIIYRTRIKRLNYDAALLSVDSPSTYVCPTTKNIVVTVANRGKKSFSGLDVNWKWNGVSQTKVSYSGTLDTLYGTGNNTAKVTLGSKSFTLGKADTLLVWTSNPGGVTDSLTYNDSAFMVFKGSYSDTLTVGGSSPKFSTIQSAIDALVQFGICSPTFVKIRPGTYNEQLTLTSIPGSNATNTVTFLSSTGDSSDVIINYSASNTANYTIGFNNTGFLRFKDVTFEALNTSFGNVVRFDNNVDDIQFRNCHFVGLNQSSTSRNIALIFRTYNTGLEQTNSIHFYNSRFSYGSSGIYMQNGYSNYANNIVIKGCVLENNYFRNIELYYSNNTTIQGNTLDRNSSSTNSGYGIIFQYSNDSLNLTGNKIYQNNGGYGIYLYSVTGKSTKRNLIGNNVISIKSTGYTYYGIYTYASSYNDFVFNSMYNSSGSNTGSSCFYMQDGGNNRLFYNNIYNANLGTAFNITSSASNPVSQSDRNNFYNGGKSLGSMFNTSVTGINDLKAIGFDSNSVSVNPFYASFTDLRPYGVDLDGRARPYNGLAFDLDNKARNTSTPDIGAYEFRLVSLDAALSEIKPVPLGNQCLNVVLKNNGATTITSAKIDWTLNGVSKTQISWTGSLAKGDTDIVCLGTINFQKDTLYKLKTWCSAPNSGTDSINSNDTLSSNFYGAMRGVYTIGGTSPDFSNFTNAVAAMKKSGILDSVYFKVRDGSYTEQIVLDNIVGASAKNSIIFESESKDKSKVTLQFGPTSSSFNYVVRIVTTHGVTFRNITLSNNSTSSTRGVLRIEGGANNVTFINNTFQNFDSSSTSSNRFLVGIDNVLGNGIEFTGNYFNRGSDGFYIYGNSSTRAKNVKIRNNYFRNQRETPIALYYVENLEFSGNILRIANDNAWTGADLEQLTGSCSINNNNFVIGGNNLYSGFYIYNYYSTKDTMMMYNNNVSVSGANDGIGVYLDYCRPANFYYNNILDQCTDSSNESSALLASYGDYRLQNNNLVHTANGYAFYTYYYYSLKSNFNNLLTNGTRFIEIDGDPYSNLADFQSTGMDTNSLSVDPLYTSSSDLHVSATKLNAAGRPVNGITKDIDGETRNSTTPDIGSDEFIVVASDAGVSKLISPGTYFAPDTLDLRLVVTNHGTDSLKQFTVQMNINGDTIARKIFNRNLGSGDTANVVYGSYIFKADSLYDILAWTSKPNGVTDLKTSNDTLKMLGVRPAMRGVYTIGGTSPNFNTFNQAVNALKLAGMVDSVIFKVRQGTYNEQISIPPIGGAFKRNSIVFESQDLDTSKVTLQYNATRSDSNWVLRFDGCDGVTFRYIKFRSASTAGYSRVVEIGKRAVNCMLSRNTMEGPATNSSSSHAAIIYSNTDPDHNFTIEYNHIRRGDYGIFMLGYDNVSPYINEYGLQIIGNRINNPYYNGIYLGDMDSVEVRGNSVYLDKYDYGYGVEFDYVGRFEFTNNNIHMARGYYPMYFYNCGDHGSKRRNLIANNTLYTRSTVTNNYGMYLYYPYYTDVLHNTVRLANTTSSTTYTLMAYYGSGNKLFNNIFSNSSFNAYIAYINNNYTFDSIDYNDFHGTSSTLAYYSGTTYSNYNDFKTNTGFEQHGVSVDPLFKGTTSMYVREVTLNGAARYDKRVPFDMDYETRDTLAPDIGADEFQLPPNDAGIADIKIPKKPYPADSQFVTIVLKNYGGNPLYVVDINWTFNGKSQTTYAWADTLQSGETIEVKLAKRFFHPDTAYSLKVWTSRPNGTGDSINNNDTMRTLNQYPALSGVYTIGGASPDFNTFTDAVNAMKRGGIIDYVRFDVRSGVYNEQISIPYIMGANKKDAIIFQSELQDSSKVYLISTNSSSNNYTVRIDSANGITFRYMNLRTTKVNGYNTVFNLLGACKNINIYNCNLQGRITGSTSSSDAIIYIYYRNSSHPTFDGIDIYNNRFSYGSMGVSAYGYGNQYGRGLRIYNNNFEDQYYIGLDIDYVRDLSIKNNNIYHIGSQYSNAYGLLAQYCTEGFEIIGNNIYNQEYYGMYLYSCVGRSQDSGYIYNNFIHTKGTNGVYGLICYYPDYVNYFNNNHHITSSNTGSYASYFYSPSRTFVYNNNFVTTGQGYAMYLQGTFSRINYNNFYTNGTNLCNRNGTNLTSLSAWRTNTGQDANSVSVDPDYVSASDLHVRAIDLDGKGRNHKYLVKFDIDGQKRDSLIPDIGADEFDIPAANDAGILSFHRPVSPFNPGVNKVVVNIKNYGSDTLKSATIKWRVNGTNQTDKSWTGKLKPGQSDTITVGNFNFVSGKKHDLIFWTTLPNGVTDTTNYNDTAYKLNLYPALKGVYTVSGTLPDYNSLADAFTALSLGGVIDSVWFKVRSGTYGYNLTLNDYMGSGARRPVYIESQSGDSSDVIFTTSSSGGHIFFMNGADFIKFRKVTFKPSNNYAVRFENGSKGLEFRNCYFDQTAYYYNYGLYSGSGFDDSLIVSGCRFDQGYYGVHTYGYSSNTSSYEKGIVIEKNIFNNQIYYPIIVQYANGPRISSNIVNYSNSSGYGIYTAQTTDNLEISYNKIHNSNNNGEGVFVINHTGNSGKKANIFNNFISINGSGNGREALYIENGSHVNMFHNSLNVYGSNSSSAALRIYSGNNLDVRNNIITNLGGGLAITYTNSATFTQSNYNDIFTTGSTLGDYNGTTRSNLAAWKSATGKDANSLSLNPSYTSNTDLHCNLSSLDSACLYISSVSNDIDLETRNTTRADIGADEFTSLPENLGVTSFNTPVNSCGLDSSLVSVRVFNFGNKPQVNFPVRYRINSGSTVSLTWQDTLKPGKEAVVQFPAKVGLAFNSPYQIVAWTDLTNEKFTKNDTFKLNFTNYSVPDTVKNMVPANNTTNMDFPVNLSWLPSSGATRYDLYFWKATDSKPSSPNVSNLTQISYQISSGLNYGEKYNWQVIAKNSVCSTPGAVVAFTMRHLPDLIVEQVTAPKSAFSATDISVSWKVKNTGQGATNGSWWDFIYLSTDAVYDVTDVYLGGIQNPSGLNASQSYNQSHTVTLPNGVNGNYYLFVVTDRYGYLNEVDNNNNSNRDTGKTVITLTPPPDLVVTTVTRPSSAFSGQPANISFTVKNKGTGATRSGGWYDNVYLSTEKVLNSNSYNLGRVYYNNNLLKDSVYTRSFNVSIPNYISGKYFILVHTDQTNREYEHSSESNNITSSDTLKIILTPPPDLIVEGVSIADTVSNREITTLDYFTINDGGTSTNGTFYDVVFICPSSTFNQSLSTYIATIYHPTSIDSKDSSIVSRSVNIPQDLNGQYYLFVVADYHKHINEVTKENNNVSAGYPIFIKSPDLSISRVTTKSTDSTGTTTPVNYVVFNRGKGRDFQGTRTDSFYLSRSATWNRSKAIPIGRLRYNPGDIASRDSIKINHAPSIPDGLVGNYYLYVYTDVNSEIFEANQDNNNVTRGNLINIQLSPYPDLIPTLVNYPDSSEAGAFGSLGYSIHNMGTTNAYPQWTDRIYVSRDSNLRIVWDTNTRTSKFVIPSGSGYSDATPRVKQLGSYIRTTSLDVNKSYNNTIGFALPADMVRGNYYLYLITDADGKVFEHIPDTNNLIRSKLVFINGYPPVDLAFEPWIIIDHDTFGTMHLSSGRNYQVTYKVKNIGDAKTPVGSWNDGIYFSTDSILTPSDLLLQTVFINKALDEDSSYVVKRSILIPNGLSGDFYLLLRSDMANATNDIDTTNNKDGLRDSTGRLVKVKVNLTPPSDLQITSWDVPSNITTGQYFKIKWKVENKGTGATQSKTWNDLFYLSTDYTIDNSDLLLGNHSFSGKLAVNGSYTDSADFVLPINKVGNFIVLIKTDGTNLEYEHSNEGNNMVSSIVTTTKAPPADLIVSSVSAPDSVMSGKKVTITWKVKNQGSNPAAGGLRDNIYLSLDNVQDGNDVLVGSDQYSLSLAPTGELTRNMDVTVIDLPLGNYNVLVTTDVLNNISESSDTNNTAVAPNLLNVNVPILPIGVKTLDTLTDDEKIYHRIIVPDSLVGQSLLVILKADSTNGNNQIYVRHNQLALASDFDYKYREPFKGNQEIIIPFLDSGVYYLLTTGSTSLGSVQNISLLARIMPFEIRRVLANNGSNTGEVTVMVEGSKFDEFTQFSLLRNGRAVPGTKTVDTNNLRYKYSGLGAQKTKYIDPTIAYVTFNLAGLDTGFYDVVATTIGKYASLSKGFNVITGEDGLLNVEIISPANTRANNVLSMEVLFSNGGKTDLVNKKLNILSTSGAPIALTIDDLSKGLKTVEIVVEEPGGPPGRLRPEGYGSVIIYTKASGALGFTIVE